jgi:hypothetical protein
METALSIVSPNGGDRRGRFLLESLDERDGSVNAPPAHVSRVIGR